MAKFNVDCPHCGGTAEVQEEWIGMEVECPYCQKSYIIPENNAQEKEILPKCPNGGHDLQPGAEFCPECGEDDSDDLWMLVLITLFFISLGVGFFMPVVLDRYEFFMRLGTWYLLVHVPLTIFAFFLPLMVLFLQDRMRSNRGKESEASPGQKNSPSGKKTGKRPYWLVCLIGKPGQQPLWLIILLDLFEDHKKTCVVILLITGFVVGWWMKSPSSGTEAQKPAIAAKKLAPAAKKPAPAPTEDGKIMFITDISNRYGRISPAMEIGIFCGQEDPELNDMIDRHYKELKNFKYKEKTQEIRAKDILPINTSLCEIMSYIGKKPDALITKYIGNLKILTGVPVGKSFYFYAGASWANGNGNIIWVKKIVVKRGENKIILVNDETAFQDREI